MPAATPAVRYLATVRVEGGAATQEDITPTATASPTPVPHKPTPPTAAPSPTPKPASFLAAAWRKVFPARPHPAPGAVPIPSPTPKPPAESFFGRAWHGIFPARKGPPLAMSPQWIGTIKLVNEREGYVLIDAANSPSLAPGMNLNSVGDDSESGVVRTTADRNAPFFIADIVSGKPRSGDRIYSARP